jgi:hypothetical protein
MAVMNVMNPDIPSFRARRLAFRRLASAAPGEPRHLHHLVIERIFAPLAPMMAGGVVLVDVVATQRQLAVSVASIRMELRSEFVWL